MLSTGIAAFSAATVLTGVVRRLVLRRGLLDVPNERSSHETPTPRGGGVAIVAVVLGGAAWWMIEGRLAPSLALGLLLGGGLVALIGFLDDHGHVPARVRFLVHLGALGGALWVAGGMPPVPWGAGRADLGLVGDVVACIACAWFLNLFNFMDGIDGIAAAEAAFVSLAAAALVAATGGPGELVALWTIVGTASLGFLGWNWPPARIFMGDVGSGFLGFVIALLLVASSGSSGLSVWTALILVAPFAADATVTLLRRVMRRERWYSAHRTHAYQWLSRRWGSHARVTLLFAAINLLLVLPAAWWSIQRTDLAPGLAAAVLGAFAIAAFAAGAGRPEREPGRP